MHMTFVKYKVLPLLVFSKNNINTLGVTRALCIVKSLLPYKNLFHFQITDNIL